MVLSGPKLIKRLMKVCMAPLSGAATVIADDGGCTCSMLRAWEFEWLVTQKRSLESLLEERKATPLFLRLSIIPSL